MSAIALRRHATTSLLLLPALVTLGLFAMAVAGLFNMTNALANGYQIEPDVRPPH